MSQFFSHILDIGLILALIIILCPSEGVAAQKSAIIVTSTAFKEGEIIPALYTCKGKDISPPLAWSNVPVEATTIVLIVDDPDAPVGTWVHWVYYNIPTQRRSLPENVEKSKQPSPGGVQSITDFRIVGYSGPCPPSGTHRYYFRVYALDTELNLDDEATLQSVKQAMKGHILATGTLMGRFSR